MPSASLYQEGGGRHRIPEFLYTDEMQVVASMPIH